RIGAGSSGPFKIENTGNKLFGRPSSPPKFKDAIPPKIRAITKRSLVVVPRRSRRVEKTKTDNQIGGGERGLKIEMVP
ncbi:hypothetical protein HK102_000718, partial [Quaeritorhiza haematococci]